MFPLLITTKIFCRLYIPHKSLNIWVSAQIHGSGSHVTTGQLGLGAKAQYDNRAKGREKSRTCPGGGGGQSWGATDQYNGWGGRREHGGGERVHGEEAPLVWEPEGTTPPNQVQGLICYQTQPLSTSEAGVTLQVATPYTSKRSLKHILSSCFTALERSAVEARLGA